LNDISLSDKFINIKFFYEKILLEFEGSYLKLFHKSRHILNENIFYISSSFLNNYLKYNYLKYSYTKLHLFFKYNKLKSRIKFLDKNKSSILGFKLHFLGRFSRKQRSSSI
jgi:hypothetical protein